MDKHLFEFFKTISEPHRPYECDNLQTSLIERTADAFARNTHQCMYISTAQTIEFFYASGKFERLSGLTAEKIKEMGFRFYLDFVPEEEHRILYTAFKEGEIFFAKPASGRTYGIQHFMGHTRTERQEKVVSPPNCNPHPFGTGRHAVVFLMHHETFRNAWSRKHYRKEKRPPCVL